MSVEMLYILVIQVQCCKTTKSLQSSCKLGKPFVAYFTPSKASKSVKMTGFVCINEVKIEVSENMFF